MQSLAPSAHQESSEGKRFAEEESIRIYAKEEIYPAPLTLSLSLSLSLLVLLSLSYVARDPFLLECSSGCGRRVSVTLRFW